MNPINKGNLRAFGILLSVGLFFAACSKWPMLFFLAWSVPLAAFLVFGIPYLYLIILGHLFEEIEDALWSRWHIEFNWGFPHCGKVFYAALLALHVLLVWQSPLYFEFIASDSGAPQHYIPE